MGGGAVNGWGQGQDMAGRDPGAGKGSGGGRGRDRELSEERVKESNSEQLAESYSHVASSPLHCSWIRTSTSPTRFPSIKKARIPSRSPFLPFSSTPTIIIHTPHTASLGRSQPSSCIPPPPRAILLRLPFLSAISLSKPQTLASNYPHTYILRHTSLFFQS